MRGRRYDAATPIRSEECACAKRQASELNIEGHPHFDLARRDLPLFVRGKHFLACDVVKVKLTLQLEHCLGERLRCHDSG